MSWKIILNGKVIKIYKNRANAVKAYDKKVRTLNNFADILELWDNFGHCLYSSEFPI